MKNFIRGNFGAVYTWLIYLLIGSIVIYITENYFHSELTDFFDRRQNNIVFLLFQLVFSILLFLAIGLWNAGSKMRSGIGRIFTKIFSGKDFVIIFVAEIAAIKTLFS